MTKREWGVLLDAANAYEAEPANFEDDPDDKRLEALRSAITKMRKLTGDRGGMTGGN